MASAGRDHHGPRRPRQDVAARLHPQGERRRGRSGRHHAAHRRVPRLAAERQEHHVPRHAGPRGLHRDARARRAGDGHRRPRRRGGRLGHAADDRSDLPRQERRRAAHRRHQQDRPAAGESGQGEAGAAPARRRARGVRRQRAFDRDLGQEGHEHQRPARPDSAPGGNPRPQGESEPSRAGNGRRSVARSGQGPGRHGARAERHAQGRRRLHLRHVLGPRPRPVRRARQARQAGGTRDSGADPRLPGRADGGRSAARRRGRGVGARGRAAPRASRSRGEEPPRQPRAASRSKTSWRSRRWAARARSTS